MPPANRPLIFVACLVSMFMVAIEATIVATALPSIVADLGGFSLFGWVFGAFLLPQVVTVPIYGRLADLYGRKKVFFASTLLFLVGSALCGFSRSMVALVLFRALQGLGGGGVLPLTQTIVGDLYKASERGRIAGYMSSVWGISAIVGPMVGALIVQHLDWALVFWINLPLGVVALGLIGALLHEAPHQGREPLDLAGAALLTLSTGSVMAALLEADELGRWALPLGLGGLAVGALLVVQQRRAAAPVLPLALWQDPTIVAGNLGSLASGALMMGITAFLPTYIQGVMGRSALLAGLALTLMSFGWPVGSMIAGKIMVRHSYRLSAALGGGAMLAGAAVLLMLDPAHGLTTAALGSTLVGLGLGLTSTAFLVSTQEAAGRARRGAATSSIVFMRSIGQSLGTALFGAVLNLGLARRLPDFGDPVQVLMDPARLGQLAQAERQALTGAVAGALHEVYLAGILIALAAALLAWRVPAGLRAEAGE